jgi:hypothetical protein
VGTNGLVFLAQLLVNIGHLPSDLFVKDGEDGPFVYIAKIVEVSGSDQQSEIIQVKAEKGGHSDSEVLSGLPLKEFLIFKKEFFDYTSKDRPETCTWSSMTDLLCLDTDHNLRGCINNSSKPT